MDNNWTIWIISIIAVHINNITSKPNINGNINNVSKTSTHMTSFSVFYMAQVRLVCPSFLPMMYLGKPDTHWEFNDASISSLENLMEWQRPHPKKWGKQIANANASAHHCQMHELCCSARCAHSVKASNKCEPRVVGKTYVSTSPNYTKSGTQVLKPIPCACAGWNSFSCGVCA